MKVIDVSALKSVEVITDPGQIHALVNSRLSKTANNPHTSTSTHEQGQEFKKISGFVLNESQLPEVKVGDLQQLAESKGLPWRDDYLGRAIPYIASTEEPDSFGDIVRQNWHFDEFETNPVLPFCHEWENPPIGNAIDWRTLGNVELNSYTGPALWLLGLFAPSDISQVADSIFRLAKSKFLRAGSVGFFSTKVIDVKDPKERQEIGLGPFGLILDENHLLEFSPCTIGANKSALSTLTRAKNSKLLEVKDFDVIREMNRLDHVKRSALEDWQVEDDTYRAIGKAFYPEARFDRHTDPEQVITIHTNEELLRSVTVPVGDIPVRSDEPSSGGSEGSTGESDILRTVQNTQLVLEEGIVSILRILQDIRDSQEEIESAKVLDMNDEPNPSSDVDDDTDMTKSIARVLDAMDARLS